MGSAIHPIASYSNICHSTFQLQDMWQILHHELSHLSPYEYARGPQGLQMRRVRHRKQVHRGPQEPLEDARTQRRQIFPLLRALRQKVGAAWKCKSVQALHGS